MYCHRLCIVTLNILDKPTKQSLEIIFRSLYIVIMRMVDNNLKDGKHSSRANDYINELSL